MSTEKKSEILLVGLGAIGTIYAYVLQASGLANVTVVARSNYDVAKGSGIHIKSLKFGNHPGWKPDNVVASIAEAATKQYDYVIVTTKLVPELLTTPQLLEPFLTAPYIDSFEQPVYVLAQNGLEIEQDLYDAVAALGKTPKILPCALQIGCSLVDNVVEHLTGENIIIGFHRPNDYLTATNTADEQATLDDLTNILKTGGSDARGVPDIPRYKFHKNVGNCTLVSTTVLTGYFLSAFLRQPPTNEGDYTEYLHPRNKDKVEQYTIAEFKGLVKENLDVAKAIGFPSTADCLPPTMADDTIATMRGMFANPAVKDGLMTSTQRDCASNLPMEVEVILGSVVRLAEKFQVDIPRIRMAYAMILVKQNQIFRLKGVKA
ncbi:6-phosphogluconate dehydrogenase C-terminal domain-like protein [Cylindrobasidium torrendii FP15055 ss-10]|uniref:6-phosphogluconate dehydrogenase C-terminal domain-like protein n=1 Tax=Cylindrobasidium torrendii FP15055 ss-10 TaxID=1314674 RepID=A0A0D7BJM1_9AGAR|nr:6-phosphogluconate dehydrogenase C-terminal domain-like protein [Cylindrobasidium torrendii FP15055 ss-10]